MRFGSVGVEFEIARDEQLETARADFEMDRDVFADDGVRVAAGGDSGEVEAQAEAGVFDFQFQRDAAARKRTVAAKNIDDAGSRLLVFRGT